MTTVAHRFSMSEVSPEEIPARVEESPTRSRANSPFLAVCEVSDKGPGWTHPDGGSTSRFSSELYDEQFNKALSTSLTEAAAIYQDKLRKRTGETPTLPVPGEPAQSTPVRRADDQIRTASWVEPA